MNAENDSDSDLGWESTTTNVDRTPKLYSDNETVVISHEIVKNTSSPSNMHELIKVKRKQEHSSVVNASYHSLVDNFDRKNEEHKQNYNNLLEQYNQLVNPAGKPDAEFHDKPPSKDRFKKLQTRVKNYLKKLEKESEDEIKPIARKKPSSKTGQVSPEL